MESTWIQCDLYCGEGYHLDPNEICRCVSNDPVVEILPIVLSIAAIAVVAGLIVLIVLRKKNKKGKK